MSIEYRGGNTWRFRIMHNGTKYETTYYSTKIPREKDVNDKKYPKEVTESHDAYKVDVKRGQHGRNKNMLFVDLAQMMLDEYIKPNRRNGTILCYMNVYNNHLLEHFGSMKLSQITPLCVQQFVNKKCKTNAVSTVKGMVCKLSCTFSKAIDWRIVKDNPCVNIIYPEVKKKNNGKTEILSADEIHRLLTTIEQWPEKRYRVAFLIAFWGGLRIGEIIALDIHDFNFKDNYVSISKQWGYAIEGGSAKRQLAEPKTDNSYREVYLPEYVMMEVRKYVNGLDSIPISGMLFYNKTTGKPYHAKTFNCALDRMIEKSGVKHITPHSLRHINATMLINSGASIEDTARQIGDTPAVIFSTYVHDVKATRKKSVGMLGDYVSKLSNTK